MDNVRNLVAADLPAVATLFQRVFRKRPDGFAPLSLISYFDALYFRNPWYDERLSSLVYESDGKIAGFVGALPFPFLLKGSRIMTVLAGNLMIDPALKNPMAAVRLLKQLFAGPQDATLTDTATDTARKLWEVLGSATIQTYSLQWVRPLKPARFAASLATRASRAFAPLEFLSIPLCAAADTLLRRFSGSPFHIETSTLHEEELSVELLLEGIRSFSATKSLVPDYDLPSLEWLTTKAAEKREYGELRRAALYDRNHSLVGWYLYYPNPGKAGQVLQCAAKTAAASRVLGHLLNDATAQGSLALIGRIDPQMVRELSLMNCLFTHRGSSVQAHARKTEVVQALHGGDAFFTRLEGEWWTRLQGDKFD
jgi:hypothetical protein